MAYKNQQSAVSKPLLIALVVVAIIGIIYFVTQMGGSEPAGSDAGGLNVPDSIRNLPPAEPQPGEPQPGVMGGGGR
jgi:hypothetical protein